MPRKPRKIDPESIPLDSHPRPKGSSRSSEVEQFTLPDLPHEPLAAVSEEARLHFRILAELAQRRAESLQLYRPLPHVAAFHDSPARLRLLRGSNRSGKTLAAAVEVGRAMTGRDPFKKYPINDGRVYAIGKDELFCGEVMYRKLFRARPFFIIRDKQTQLWRTFEPNNPDDVNRMDERKPAPPLIPDRYVRKPIAWEDKARNIPKIIRLTSGWEITFFSSKAKPPQGSDIDIFWMSEEIVDPDWLGEMQARVVDRGGRGIWDATPQAGTLQLYDQHERAEEELELPRSERMVEEFVLLLYDNDFMGPKEKKDFESTVLGDAEKEVRIHGQFALDEVRIFPEYNEAVHHCEPFEIPNDWTRYAFYDPGRQRAGVLFLAVPPPHDPEHGGFAYFYAEIYLRQATARMVAEAVHYKLGNVGELQAQWIDMREARKRETGSGLTIREQYAKALREFNVRTIDTGSDFYAAALEDSVKPSIEAFRGWLLPDKDGKVRCRIFSNLDNLGKQLRTYRYQKKHVAGAGYIVTDTPDKKRIDLCDLCRYAAQADPPYVKPRRRVRKISQGSELLETRRRQRNKGKRQNYINLGPP